ncbi:N-acetyl-1-D-myo-inositol-2-amino-2-deoxy-alpha-D-glucopyranoside deacetylase [Propionicimonas paludicola]|uniref:N-acetyl-1-D-myo-inositol-2-amino-2-deoxy-alpha-D-glucopyranoside deacetylase n=1 Tax=Propionicimonas paludicola TaxID=185243 RepID=A0A2A9CUC7_9ACTN|nr:PIG-L family deacetylase [Propionicimonas paludicola]PFG18053.1 N-acetyl-1-D-myo-inositol-2-amino-2-deoxy-alpha-D-glucopyranoside deacetylase [Propionicimonas paludicola]
MRIAPGVRVALLHAHPDDETLATGALVAELVGTNPVLVVTATRGERGEIVPGVLPTSTTPAQLTTVRQAELASALAALGVAEHCFLGTAPARTPGRPPREYRDSGMAWVRPGVAGPAADAEPSSLALAGTDEPAADLAALLIQWRADLLLSYAVDGGYGHPDHVACHLIAGRAASLAGIRCGEFGTGPAPAGAVGYDYPQRRGAVRAALDGYRTQLTRDGDQVVHVGGQREPVTTAGWLRELR